MGGFRFAYDSPTVRGGAGSVGHLADELAELDCERALVVCGRRVGANDDVLGPVRAGLGDRLGGVFAETTPEKRLGTAIRGRAYAEGHGIDAVVGLGGGSSLDIAKLIAALYVVERPATAGPELVERGTVTVPDGEIPPVVAVPTTLAGADLSRVAGVTADPETCPVDEPASGGVGDDRLMPAVTAYDPELVATTPFDVLAGSAMNGFDKGIETLYSRARTPITDATAGEGLARLAPALRTLRDRPADMEVLGRILEGLYLVQFGISRRDRTTASIIHAFGHGLTAAADIQQGVAHAIIAPHVLAYLFDEVDARRGRIARALDVPRGVDPAQGIVEEVAEIRDALGLPRRLRAADGPEPEEFPAIVENIAADSYMGNRPRGVDPTEEELVGILEAAY